MGVGWLRVVGAKVLGHLMSGMWPAAAPSLLLLPTLRFWGQLVWFWPLPPQTPGREEALGRKVAQNLLSQSAGSPAESSEGLVCSWSTPSALSTSPGCVTAGQCGMLALVAQLCL